VEEEDEERAGGDRRHDPAAPHTAPLPSRVPRWLAWLLLAAFAVSGGVCVRMLVG
jgi:hypothetical protein